MVMDAQGGVTKEACTVLQTITNAVAQPENSDVQRCKNDLFERIALAIARHGASAVKRRRVPAQGAAPVEACFREIDRAIMLGT